MIVKIRVEADGIWLRSGNKDCTITRSTTTTIRWFLGIVIFGISGSSDSVLNAGSIVRVNRGGGFSGAVWIMTWT